MTASAWWRRNRLCWASPRGQRVGQFRPFLEPLEDRTVLSPTSTSLTASPPRADFGSSIALVAQVTQSGETVTEGSVDFFDVTTNTDLGSVPLDPDVGGATLSTGSLDAQTHLIQANYSGDAFFDPSSGTATVIIDPVATTTTVFATPPTSVFGQPVAFVAAVVPNSSNATAPSGTIDFFDATTGSDLGQVALDAQGHATLTTSSLDVATHAIQATYLGDNHFAGSAGLADATVGPASTITALDATPSQTFAGGTVLLSANVTVVSPGAGTPGGSVVFVDLTTGTTLGTAILNAGKASLVTTGLSLGTHVLAANYAGDGHFLASSAQTTVEVSPVPSVPVPPVPDAPVPDAPVPVPPVPVSTVPVPPVPVPTVPDATVIRALSALPPGSAVQPGAPASAPPTLISPNALSLATASPSTLNGGGEGPIAFAVSGPAEFAAVREYAPPGLASATAATMSLSPLPFVAPTAGSGASSGTEEPEPNSGSRDLLLASSLGQADDNALHFEQLIQRQQSAGATVAVAPAPAAHGPPAPRPAPGRRPLPTVSLAAAADEAGPGGRTEEEERAPRAAMAWGWGLFGATATALSALVASNRYYRRFRARGVGKGDGVGRTKSTSPCPT